MPTPPSRPSAPAGTALLLSVAPPGVPTETLEAQLQELSELVAALGYAIVGTIVQKRHAHPSLYVGEGKLEEVAAAAKEQKIALLAVNADLRPGQLFRLERRLHPDQPDLKVFDRSRIILEVFSSRAQSPEARLQVERAMLEYEIPFIREYIHRMKTGEHAGYMAGGEQTADIYLPQVTRRRKRIDAELEKLRTSRAMLRERRRDGGYFLVAIAGYTNAGKSTLMRTMTGEQVVVEDRVFSTLAPLTRRAGEVPLPSWAAPGRGAQVSKQLLLTDTVGFVQDLPPLLLEAFRATLEEMTLADAILLVLDCSDDVSEMARKLTAALGIIGREDSAQDRAILLVCNKTDRLEPAALQQRLVGLQELLPAAQPLIEGAVAISAKSGAGMDRLAAGITGTLRSLSYVQAMEVRLPKGPAAQALRAWVHGSTLVVSTRTNQRREVLDILCKAREAATLQRRVAEVGGEVLPMAGAKRPPQRPTAS